ncbi:MAG: MarR family winged helix-turn-helix transcriptional regulator [Gemmatimonadales bacterium]
MAFELSSLGYAVSRGFKEAMAAYALEPRDFAVLRTLGAVEGQSQQALASRLQIPPSRMVAIVDQLELRGLVERRPHATDRRIRELFLTATGRELFAQAHAEALGYDRHVTASLSRAEREQLLDLLARIAADLGIGVGPAAPHAAVREEQEAPGASAA